MKLKPFVKKNLSQIIKDYLYTYINEAGNENIVKIPSENDLAENLSVSRITVRRALSELESEGLILRIQGKGTFINLKAMKMNLNLNPSREFYHLIASAGYKSRVKLLEVCEYKVNAEQAQQLEIDQNQKITKIEKVFYADDNVAIYCIDYVPSDYLDSESNFENESTFKLIHQHSGKIVVRDYVEFDVCSVNDMKDEVNNLSIMKSDALLAMNIIDYDEKNNPVFLSKIFYNTKYIRFSMLRNVTVNYD